jgi:hypothetical protein
MARGDIRALEPRDSVSSTSQPLRLGRRRNNTWVHEYMDATACATMQPVCMVPCHPGSKSTVEVPTQVHVTDTILVGWVLNQHQPILYCTTAAAVVQVRATQQYKHLHVQQAWGFGSRPEVL